MSDRVSFIFAGRLTKEKGFDDILHCIEKIQQNKKLRQKVHINIFGKGVLENKIPSYDFVSFRGFCQKKELFETRKKCHYCFMPSKFLETFGLSALDSLSLGVPVIGERKGGLKQFVLKELAIKKGSIENVFFDIVKHFDKKKRKRQCEKSRTIFEKYTRKKRLKRFQYLSGLKPGAKILLVSDFKINVGGIESFLQNLQGFLKKEGYRVEFIGCENKRLAHHRFVSLLQTFWNIKGVSMFQQKVKNFRPDLIRRHSVQRWFGPLVFYKTRDCASKQRVMYHDFGLFHPYPSRVYIEKQLYRSATCFGYIQESLKHNVGQNNESSNFLYLYLTRICMFFKNIVFLPLVFAKLVSSFLIKQQLQKNVDLHTVPSKYMEKIVQINYKNIPKKKIKTLSHFV